MQTRQSPQIRPARLDDAPPIAALASQLGYPVSAQALRERLARAMARPDQAIFVAEQHDAGVSEITGWVQIWIQPPLVSNPSEAEIVGLIVDEKRRGEGIGQSLVRTVEAWALERGAVMMRVRSNITRDEAHRFYQNCGFRTAKTQHVFQKALGA